MGSLLSYCNTILGVNDNTRYRNEIERNNHKYDVEELLGRGSYGEVYQCRRKETNEKVAVKAQRRRSGKNETMIMTKLCQLDPDKSNLVKLIDSFNFNFIFNPCVCLVFEMLDITLSKFVEKRHDLPLHSFEIQSITQQMLVALNALKSIGVVHTDIHPKNIMIINCEHHPIKVKLIDFGVARTAAALQTLQGKKIQPISFRAPEVILGLPMNEAIDMWSLGCIVAYMFLGRTLMRGCEHQIIKALMETEAQTEFGDQMLNDGIYTKCFFRKNNACKIKWKVTTHDEYFQAAMEMDRVHEFHSIEPLNPSSYQKMLAQDMMKCFQDYEDIMAILCLLKQMLNMDQVKRITPSESLSSRLFTEVEYSCIKQTTDDRIHATPEALLILLSHLDESTGKFKPLVNENNSSDTKKKLSATAGSHGASTYAPTSVTSCNRCAADNSDRPSEKPEVDDTIAVGPDELSDKINLY